MILPLLIFTLCLGTGAATCKVTTALGCYDDSSGPRLLNDFSQLGSDTTPMTHDICAQLCHDHVGSTAVAGVEFAHQCFCAKALPGTATKVDGCNMACSANATENCGDSGKLYAYEFNCSGRPTPTPPPPTPPANFCPDYTREYCQPGVALEERIRRLMAHMTTQDKMDTMAEQSIAGTYLDGTPLVARGVGWWQESLHGLRTDCGPGANSSDCATQFAEANGMSCAFNTSLVHDTADAISTEARAFFAAGHLGGLTFFAPQINMASNPLWGRNMETPGEDPHLSASFARAYVDGLQGPAARAGGNGNGTSPVWKTVATPKHFVGQFFEGDGSDPWGNGTTVNRQSNDTRYTLQDLEQYYLPSFRAALVDAKAGSLMCAYQGVNGVPMCANGFILNRIVRDSWGWEGFIVSDCDAIKTMMVRASPGGNPNFGHAYSLTGTMAVQDGVRAGCDSNCGDPYRRFGAQAVSEGVVTPLELDASVRRLLRPMFLMGLFDNPATQSPSYTHYSWTDVRSPAHRQLALEGARQSLVLLAHGSRVNGVDTAPTPLLPLRPGGRVLVAGPHYNATLALLGNYNGPPCQKQAGSNSDDGGNCLTSVLQAVQAVNDGIAGGVTKAVAGMTDPCTTLPDGDAGIASAAAAASSSDVDTVVLVLGGACHEGEGTDRDSLDLPGSQQTLFDTIYNATAGSTTGIVVVLLNGGPYGIDAIKAHSESDLSTSTALSSPQSAVAVLQANFPGQEGAQAIAEALFGQTNDFGKLTTTVYPRSYAHGEPLGGTPWMDSRLRPHAGGAAQGFPAGRSEGRTHMFYTGTPLWPFGYGLSYTTFDLSWSAGTNTTNVAMLPLANVSAGLPAISFTVRVTNTGSVAGKEIVLAYWCPPNDVDSELRQQLIGFNSTRLRPGEHAELTFALPTARELATVTPTGDRIFLPGSYTVRFSRGHGRDLQTEVHVLPGNTTPTGGGSEQVMLSTFPTRWVDGHEVTVEACTEGTSDVIAHTEDWLVDYKRWSWMYPPIDAIEPNTGRLKHVASGMCLQREPTADGGSLALRACANDSVATAQQWSYAQINGTFFDPNDPVACLATTAHNASALRAKVTVGGGCANDRARWVWHAASGFVQSALPGALPLCLAARAEGVFNQAS